MKLQIEQKTLAKLASQSASVVERRNTIPILAHVSLRAEGDKLTFTATDLDVEMNNTAECRVLTPGATTVSAQMLSDISSKLPSGALVAIELIDDILHVYAGKSKFKLATLPAADFPVMASQEYESEFDIPAYELKRLFDKTKFAMSNEETRYYLNGAYLHNADGNIRAVSTDAHKLARVDYKHDVAFPGVIVPRKTVAELSKILDVGDVTVSVSETKIRVKIGSVTLVSKVIDGTFPDYTRVIPVNNVNNMTVDAKSLSAAVSRVAIVSDEKARAVKMTIQDDTCVLTVNGSDGNAATEELAVSYSGPKIEVGFNAKYVAEIMSQAEGGNVTVQFGNSDGPALFRFAEDDGTLALAMPMRV